MNRGDKVKVLLINDYSRLLGIRVGDILDVDSMSREFVYARKENGQMVVFDHEEVEQVINKIRFSKTHPEAVTPIRAKEGDAGYDLTAVTTRWDSVHHYLEYDTDIAVEIPSGFVGLCFMRSSISNKSLSLTNAVGVVDSGYRGSIKARFRKLEEPGENDTYKIGDRIIQLVIVPISTPEFEEVPYNELSNSDRGSGGFGSSGG